MLNGRPPDATETKRRAHGDNPRSQVSQNPPESARLTFTRFRDSDGEALAELLRDPEITRTITANTSTPERRAACARHRIAWHNGAWGTKGYGVWALRAKDLPAEQADRLIGWCGFTEPEVGADPEILYGLARDCWGRGLASEAAVGAIDWLFAHAKAGGVSALIMARLNHGSLKVAERLGFTRRGTMSFQDFLPDPVLAREVLDYEIWRLGEGETLDPDALIFQAPYKAGQITATGIAGKAATLEALFTAARRRADYADLRLEDLEVRVRGAFRQGLKESHVDWYHLPRQV